MTDYKINEAAQLDLEEIKKYFIEADAKEAYEKLQDKLFALFDTIVIFPNLGKVLSYKRWKKYRYLVLGSYYIFYRISEQVILIDRILHTARNYKDIL